MNFNDIISRLSSDYTGYLDTTTNLLTVRYHAETEGSIVPLSLQGVYATPRSASRPSPALLGSKDADPVWYSIDTIFRDTIDIDIFDNAEHPEKIGIIYGDTNIVDHHGNFLRQRHLSAPEQLTWASFQKGMLVCHQSFYARRTLCPMYDTRYRFSADVDWCIRVMKAGAEQGLTNLNMHSVLTDYLDGGMTGKNHRASLIERFRIMAHYYGLMTTIWNHFLFLFR